MMAASTIVLLKDLTAQSIVNRHHTAGLRRASQRQQSFSR
jgi:hypothetical protein